MTRAKEPEAKAALGAAIRSERVALDLSQDELGEQAGLHRTYVGGIERGERNPSYVNLILIARALRIPLSALIEKAESKLPRQ